MRLSIFGEQAVETQRNFDVAVLIGRFQPFHNGHAALLAHALASASRAIVVLGSALQARNAKNPFTWEERAAMIRASLDESQASRLSFAPMRDYYDESRWRDAVAQAVRPLIAAGDTVALVGFKKDESSRYLNRFPEWDSIVTPQFGDIDATRLRRIFFEDEDAASAHALLSGLTPAPVAQYLLGWRRLPHFACMREEHLAVERYKRQWGEGPFVTVDAVVRAHDHVLLIRRGRFPGKGLWAAPGGFLEPRERLLQGAMRELREETGVALSDSTLEQALVDRVVFDHPDRSIRGRTITHVHFFDLGQTPLPEVKGADDAADARWVSIAELAGMEDRLFEDHFIILDRFFKLTDP